MCSTAVVLTDGDSEFVSFPRYHKDSGLFFDRIVNALPVSVPATLCVVDKALELTAYYLLLFLVSELSKMLREQAEQSLVKKIFLRKGLMQS